jgi:effector-binding domain-containing protein
MEYDVAIIDYEEQRIISIRDRREQQAISHFIGRSFDELFGHLRLLGVEPAGPPFVAYHEFGPHEIDAEVCVPVGGSVEASGRVRTRLLPAMTVARTLHVGPYEQLGEAYRAIGDWAERRHLEGTGPLRERYLNGPGQVASPAEYRTEIELPIDAAAVAAPV